MKNVVSHLHVSGHIVGDNGEKVVGVGLFEVPQDGEVSYLHMSGHIVGQW